MLLGSSCKWCCDDRDAVRLGSLPRGRESCLDMNMWVEMRVGNWDENRGSSVVASCTRPGR